MRYKSLLNRTGRFKISNKIIIDKPYYCMKIFSKVVIVKVDTNLATDDTEYWGYSPRFRPVILGDIVPSYNVYLDIEDKVIFKEIS